MAKAKTEKAPKSKKADKKEKAAKKGKAAAAKGKKAAPTSAPPRPLRTGEHAWPARRVLEEFGSKAKLVAAVKKLVSDDLLEDRLSEDKGLDHVSNRKLLRLHEIGTRVKTEFGGREGLIGAILEVEKRTKDEGYRRRLERYSTPRLLDIVESARRRAKRSAA